MQLVNSTRQTLASGLRELTVRPSGQLPSLDALRSFAILLVIGSHWAVADYVAAGGAATPFQNDPLFYYGWTGVDLFFVLSGLLIGRQLWRELERTGDVRLGRFLVRRGLRIWPIYFVMIAFYAVTSGVVHPRWPDWVFLSNYVGGGFPRGWSLSTEEQFYIAVPLLLLLVRRRVPLIGYLWIFGGIEALVLTVRHFRIVSLVAAGVPFDHTDYTLVYPFHVHLEGLLVGLVIALLTVARPTTFKPRAEGGFSALGFAALIAGAVAALTLRHVDQHLFAFLTLGLFYGGATMFALLDRSWLSAPLRWRVWYPISRLSYGMYLNHLYITPTTNRIAVRAMQALTANRRLVFAGSLGLVTIVSIAVAVVTFVVIEHPFLLLRDRIFRHAGERAPVAGVMVPAGALPLALGSAPTPAAARTEA